MASFGRFWRTDRGLTALLVFLVLGLLVVPPMITAGRMSPLLVEISLSLILISGVFLVSNRRWPAMVAVAMAIVSFGVRWIRVGTDEPVLRVLDSSLSIATFLILAALVLVRVLGKGEITLHRVQGALAAYLLLGLVWASAYELLFLLRPEAFRFPDSNPDRVSLLYYSFVTLTTVGYGDITPVHPVARSLAISEALIGQLFPAVLIARLVSMEIAARDKTRR